MLYQTIEQLFLTFVYLSETQTYTCSKKRSLLEKNLPRPIIYQNIFFPHKLHKFAYKNSRAPTSFVPQNTSSTDKSSSKIELFSVRERQQTADPIIRQHKHRAQSHLQPRIPTLLREIRYSRGK